MSEDIYAKPDLTKKVRFQTGEKEDKNTDVSDSVDDVRIYDNYWAEGRTPPESLDITTEDQQQTTSVNVSSRKRNLLRAAAVFLCLLCLLVAVIVLVVLLIQDKSNWNMERNRLWVDNANLASQRDRLQRNYSETKSLNAKLTSQRDGLQINYSEIKNLNAKLTSQREELQRNYTEVKSLNHILTSQSEELQRNYTEVKSLNHILTSQSEELQRNYTEVKSLNHILTQKTSQSENEKDLLKAINNNLTKEKDKLQKQIETTRCPDNWIKFGNSCYLINTSKENWNNSRKICESHNAQLLIISSIEEQKFFTFFNRQIWLGLTDEESENVWKWVNGTEATTVYWKKGQPDNRGAYKSENCAEIVDIYPTLENWNDLTCSDQLHFICERILQ